MRFIGNKEKLLNNIHEALISHDIKGDSFFDFFAGTGNVGKYFKKLGYAVYSSDLLYFSYVLQMAYIMNNEELKFNKLLNKIKINRTTFFSTPLQSVIDYLNQVNVINGFIYRNYTPSGTKDLDVQRMFFIDENGQKIDAIRQKIEDWKIAELLSEKEYFCLLACLIETVPFYANISGVYAAFQKKWDPRSIKPIILRPIDFICNDKKNVAYNKNSLDLINEINVDILYLDPPYNQRQYAPNYHLLETIARYDNPEIKGVSGMRNYDNQKSNFCNAQKGLQELEQIAARGNYKYLVLSYNSEGIMPAKEIIKILKKFGSVDFVEFDYLRFKSNNHGESKTEKYIKEQLYILKK